MAKSSKSRSFKHRALKRCRDYDRFFDQNNTHAVNTKWQHDIAMAICSVTGKNKMESEHELRNWLEPRWCDYLEYFSMELEEIEGFKLRNGMMVSEMFRKK